MSKSKPYKEAAIDKQIVNEPVVEYASTAITDEFVDTIPRDALEQAARFAINEHRRERCISHVELDSLVKERMGWK